MSRGATAIKITNLYKRYGKHEGEEILKDVNLDIKSGEFIVFVGPPRAAASRRCCADLGPRDLASDSATLEIDGRVVNDVAPSKRGIAMVFQTYALYPHMTVYDNMAYSRSSCQGLPKAEIRQKVEAAADKLQLTNYLDACPRRSRAASASASPSAAPSCATPRCSCSTSRSRTSTRRCACRCAWRSPAQRAAADTTMVYVTHDQVEAMTLADRIVVLKDGEVQQVGRPWSSTTTRNRCSSRASSARRR
jgi:multiple sugar transport system ATP-binding protein